MDNTPIWQIILTTLGVGGGYIAGRKKNKAEVRKLDAEATMDEMSATEKAVAIWRGLAQEFRGEVEHLRDLVIELKKEIDELKSQNTTLSEEMKAYKMINHD